jgi:hypothetical protein
MNVLLWFCHNCGNGGALNLGVRAGKRANTRVTPKDNTSLIAQIWGRSEDTFNEGVVNQEAYALMGTGARRWLGDPCVGRGWCWRGERLIKYDAVSESIVFGIYQEDNYALCKGHPPPVIQQRFFRRHGAKCITTKAYAQNPARMMWEQGYSSNRSLVVVEDLLSMYHVANAARKRGLHNLSAYALCGNSMQIDEIVRLKNEYGVKELIVWLDNDQPIVVNNAHAIAARATNLGLTSSVVGDEVDPKDVIDTDELMKKVMNE